MSRRTKSIQCFCLPDELRELIDATLVETGGRVYATHETGATYRLEETTFPEAARLGNRELYLSFPEVAESGVLDSLAGIPQIWLPVVSGDSISMSVLSLLIDDKREGDSKRGGGREPAVLFEAVRKKLNAVMLKGVVGRNSKTGAERRYGDILISEGAAKLASHGIALKSQFGDGFVTFHVSR